VNLSNGVLRSPFGTETIGAWFEVRLEDRFQHQLQRGLHNPVGNSWDTQRADLALPFGDRLLPHPLGNELSGLEIIP